MNGLQIKQKMFIGILVPLLMLVTIGFIAIYMMGKIEYGVERIYNDRVVPLDDLKVIADKYAVDVIDAINKANAGGFSASQAANALENASKTINQYWPKYLATELTQEESRLAQQAEQLFLPANQQVELLISYLRGRNGDVAYQLNDKILPLYQAIDPISGKISELIALQIKIAGQERAAANEIYHSSIAIFATLAGLAMLISILIGLWVNRSVMNPINDIVRNLKTIRQDSDLTIKFRTFNDDELGLISTSLTQVIEHLRGILHSIAEAANTVNSSATELSSFTQETNKRMQQQQAETEQTATAMNEMTATVAEVAQSTSAAADSAKDADTYAANGNRIVIDSISSMSQLSEQIQKTAQVIGFLSNESQSIGRVLDVIKSIAEQTNLLALNAAIEAARAGEQGRGFAVVADEVRTLAQRTQKSTQEIEAMIATLQKGVKEAVNAMEVGIKQVDDANNKANEAGQALKEIVASVDNIAELNAHIATAAEEQSSVAESINRSIIAISDITDDSTRSAHELSESVINLTKLASSMRNQVSAFRL
ncbi:methyl-accepting chemotaxis protein [Shewanella xiamenensis]|uniref:Methyl-accepting chemotaxis protein n=1 Tax=Shewanella xiamenensis TaxID=332186 RepID=A0AAE4TNQ4_9GAMM|nr:MULTISPECIES: methyl-accepting chemotaxis protein [Shewanella]MDI5836632.1 methyl-accepting chemotaxis protein [Shewanella xiamenensis]MDI5840815.1 methyl-accepting chemotaxis protein [Shewanella xiamenensis]MDI5845690.1 methyl-accepting chemotaxis protein [Shewanella xiamenensis]MDI5848894.1 methyl-accepting chemotaxis protein [Shewanella xiamenensis]MDI5853565.1 methyl-accepting chemotaxis protein [Shewanella xiamenensis]